MTETADVDRVREFVIAGHGDLNKVKALLGEQPELLNMAYDWGQFEGNTETALQAASHVGDRAIAEYLLAQGAPMHITTAVMLGRADLARQLLESDRANARARGAHGISLMSHAVFSMDTDLLQMLLDYGATMDSHALFAPIVAGRLNVVAWLLDHGATDLSIQNFRGQTPLDAAEAAGQSEIAALLRSRL